MKTILIIPYRNRKNHLDYFLKNSWPKLKEKVKDMEIIIVEQKEGREFNRGATINVGYLYYNEPENYYITQDVDVNPIKKETLEMYNCDVGPNFFLGIYSDGQTLGGIVKFKGSTFNKVNGFPNDYWGWGHEDKDLQNRAEFYKCNIKKLIKFDEYKKKEEYFKIFEDNHIRKDCGKWGLAYGAWRHPSTTSPVKKKYIENNGLSTIKWKILKDEILMEGVRKISVEFNI